QVYTVAQQAAGQGEFSELVDGGQALLRREGDNSLAPRVEIRISRDQQRIDVLLHERREGGVELLIVAGLGDGDALTDAARCLLDLLQLARRRRKVRVEQNPDERGAGGQLAQ